MPLNQKIPTISTMMTIQNWGMKWLDENQTIKKFSLILVGLIVPSHTHLFAFIRKIYLGVLLSKNDPIVSSILRIPSTNMRHFVGKS